MKMKKLYLMNLFTIALMMMVSGIYAQTVKLVLVKGLKYEVSTIMQTSSVASVMGQEMENNMDNTTIQSVEVKEIRSSETDLTAVTTKLQSSVSTMGQEMNYDSDKKDNSGPLAETFDKMVGKVKNITIDATGKLIKADKEETEATLSAALGGGEGAGFVLLHKAIIGKEMKPGNSWNDSVVNNTEKMKSTTVGTYTVSTVNPETHTAIILFTGKQTGSGTIEQMGQEMVMTSSSNVESQYEVNINTGVISKSSVITNGTSNIDAMGMSIPVTIKSTITTTIKPL